MNTTKSTITEITIWESHNYVEFDDTDSRGDYFNGYCLGLRRTIEWINRDGGDRILVRFGNGIDRTKYRKRLAAICKHCGYSCESRHENVQTSDGVGWTISWFILTKIHE